MESSNIDSTQVLALLTVMTSQSPNKTELDQANSLLKAYGQNKASLEGFLSVLVGEHPPAVKQLAAVLLNKNFEKRFSDLPADKQALVAEHLFSVFTTEQVSLVSRSVATLVFKVVKTCIIQEKPSKLVELVFANPAEYANHQVLFENLLYVLSLVLDTCYAQIQEQLPNIYLTIKVSLEHNPKIKENAAICLGNLIESFPLEQLEQFKDLSTVVLTTLPDFDESSIKKLFQIFANNGLKAVEFFGDYLENLLQTTRILLDKEIGDDLKAILVDFIVTMVEHKKKLFKKNDHAFLKAFLEAGYTLSCFSEENPEIDLNYDTGLRVLQVLSDTFSSKQVFPFCVEKIKQLLPSANWAERKVAIASIGSLSTGCSEKIKQNLDDILKMLISTFRQDPDIRVKGACIISIDFVKQATEPEVNRYEAEIMSMFVEALNSADPTIVEKSLVGIYNYCDTDMADISKFFNEILEKTVAFILAPDTTLPVQQQALQTLTAVLSTAETVDPQVASPILTKCVDLLNNANPNEHVFLMANSLDCVSEIALKVEKDLFLPSLEIFADHAFKFCTSKTFEFQDAGFNFFNKASTLLKEDFTPYLEKLMPIAFSLFLDDSGFTRAAQNDDNGFDSDSEVEQDDDLLFDNAFIDAKCSVIMAVAFFCESAPKGFNPYLHQTMEHYDKLWGYAHENVTIEIAKGYSIIMRAINKAEAPSGGVSENVLAAWNTVVFHKLTSEVQNSDAKELVTELLLTISLLVKELGPTLLSAQQLAFIMNLVKTLLKYESVCQMKNDQEEEDEIDPDEELMKAITELLLILSDAYGNEFKDEFDSLAPHLFKYLGRKRCDSDKDFAISLFAYLIDNCPVVVPVYAEKIIKICLDLIEKDVKDGSDRVTRNSIFCVGNLFKHYFEGMKPNLEKIFSLIRNVETDDQGTKDNIVVCLIRIIRASQFDTSLLGFAEMFQIIVEQVPLTDDLEENKEVSYFFADLLAKSPEDFKQHAEKAFKAVLFCLSNPDKVCFKGQEQRELAQFVKNTQNEFSTVIQAVLATLNAKEQSAVQLAVESC